MKPTQSFALVICGIALLAFAGMLKPEPVRKPPPPEPTSDTLLAVFDAWGAKYKLNEHGQVDWLWLKRLPLTDDDLELLSLVPQVKYLNMRGIHTIEGQRFTNDGIQHLTNLKNLERLDLSANHFLTDECAPWLGKIKSLRELNLASTALTDASLPHLSQLENLVVLKLYVRKSISLSKETVPYFRQLPLRILRGIRIQEDNRHLLPELRHLERYPTGPVSSSVGLRDVDLVHIRHIKGIDRLSVSLTNGWSDASQLRHLQALPKLKYLSVGSGSLPAGDVDREGIRCLKDVPSLRVVLPGHINDEVLEALSHCSQIALLDLSSTANDLTSDGIRFLARMPNLKALSLRRTLVNDATIEIASRIEPLEVLSLDGHDLYPNRYGDSYRNAVPREFSLDSLRLLARLGHLKSLSVDYWQLGDEALEHLAQIKTLENLSIADNADRGSGIPISESGLLQLRRLSNLKYLNFFGTSTSLQSAERLHEFLPDCHITDNWCCGCMSIGPRRPFQGWRTTAGLDH